MLYYDRIDISERIDLGDLCNDLCNGSHVLTMLSVNINDTAIVTIKKVDYCCNIHNISKSEAINVLENSILENYGYR